MINIMTRVVGVILAVVLLATASLYLFSNFDQVLAFSSGLLAPMRSKAADPVETDTATMYPGMQRNSAAGTTSARGEEEGDAPDLPLFLFENMLSLEPEVTRVIFVLGEGSEGNLWLVRRAGDRWYTEAGPLYCRLGRSGITAESRIKDKKTATGWRLPDTLYAAGPLENVSWPVTPSQDHQLALHVKGLEENPESAYIMAGDVSAGSQGAICLSEGDMQRLCAWLDPGAVTLVGVFEAARAGWTVEPGMAEGFVFLSDVAPGIREDARYASRNNFMGRPLDGYLGNRIVVAAQVGEALARVQQELEGRGLGLLVYDGYRPARAVDNIYAWMADPEDNVTAQEYYPTIAKQELRGIYLAEYSPHTKGIAVDLTLCDLLTGEALDMGTGFDFFAPASWYESREVTAQQRENRKLLRNAMMAAGFEPYSKEWWHFNYTAPGVPNAAYDFVIPQ